ncbi:protein rep [Psychrobacter aquimaris]|uniref:protein rep n=1 Tax=Psychrobacter aquimaris TaxID=292733 RepID=UPI003FD33AC9
MTILTPRPLASSKTAQKLLKLTVKNNTVTPLSPQKITFSDANQRLDRIVPYKKMADSGKLGSITKSQSTTNSDDSKNLSKSQSNRRSAYALKNTSAKLLPAERVRFCLNHRVDPERGVDVRLNKSNGKAGFGNLVLCDSVWVCPCCSARILAKRGEEVAKGVETWTEAGGSVFMLTLTHKHKRIENPKQKMKLLQKALSRFFGDRSMKAIFEQFGKVGQIKALETTYSEANGWHPHHHILMFSKMSPENFLSDSVSVTFDENNDVEYVTPHREKKLIKDGRIDDIKQVTFEYFIKSYWIKICRAVGLGVPSLKHGATMQNASAVKTYLTKFKTAQELTNAQAKRAKGDSRNQWEILADAHNGCDRSAQLWQIYADAFKGQRQLFWSRGLKDLLLIDEIADHEIEELAELKDDEIVTVIELAVEDWGYIRKKNWQAQLLEIVENDFKNDSDNLGIFIYSVKKLMDAERALWEQKEQERIANLCPPDWFSETDL